MFLVHECPFRRLESGEALDKEKLKDMWYKITMGVDDQSLPQDIDGKAQKALGIMGALVSQYPFPAWIFKTKEGSFGTRSAPEPVSFANLDEVHAWVKDMRQSIVVFTSEFWGEPGILLALLKEFSKSERVSEQKELFMKSPMMSRKVIYGLEIHITRGGMEPLLVYSDFLNGLRETMSVVKSTEIYVKRAEKLGSGYPSKLRLGILLFLVVVGFCFGVIYPLTAAKVGRVFALWLPLFIYVVIGFLVLEIIL